MSNQGRVLSNLSMKLDHKAGGLIREKNSLTIFEPVKKRILQARIDELEEVLERIEEKQKGGDPE